MQIELCFSVYNDIIYTIIAAAGGNHVDKVLFEQLNGVYAPLRQRAQAFTARLNSAGHHAAWGWYADHTGKIDGEYCTEHFPIPVIDVAGGSCGGGCDVGFHIDEVFVEFQLTRGQIGSFDFGRLPGSLEVYGAEDYLRDFYHFGMDLQEIPARVLESGEAAVCVCTTLPGDADDSVLMSVVERCLGWKRAENM